MRDRRHRSRDRDYRDRRDDSRDRARHRRDARDDSRERDYRGRRDDSRDRLRRRRDQSVDSDRKSKRGDSRERNKDKSPPLTPNKQSEEEKKKQERAAKVAAWKAKLAAQKQQGAGNGEKKEAETPPSNASPGDASPAPFAGKFDPKAIAERAVQRSSSRSKVNDLSVAKGSGMPPLAIGIKIEEKKHPVSDSIATQPLKVSGNVSSFGLKSKAKLAVEKLSSKRTLLLDDEEVTKRRTLEKLPDPLPQDEQNGYAEGDDEDIDMEDVGSDEESAAAARAAAAKRRDEAQNNGDIQMAEASNGPQDDASNSTNDEREDIDPLDAFMSGLKDPEPDANPAKEQAVAMFSDNDDLNIDNVETNPDDILAMASKKKKKDIPTIDHSKIEYEPFRKCFYTEPIELQEMTEEEVADLRLELDGIKVRGVDVPKPVQSWAQMGLSMQSLEVLRKLGYEKPTSIQSQAIPCVSSGRDCIGVAKTGSGKTAAFLLPLFRHIKDQRPLESSDGPIGLIMAPTRELATQIHSECKPFLKALSLKACVCYGGAPIKDQIAEIKRGAHIVVSTPGRLIDLLAANQGRVLNLRRVTYVVLDEADRMFDMGFEPQVMKVLANIRPQRQTVLFSATFPRNMEALARKVLTRPVEIIVGGKSVVAPEITQIVKVIPPEQKLHGVLLQLGELFEGDNDARALIFVERQETAEMLLDSIMKKGYPCQSIHGGKDQVDREEAISDFRAGVVPVLVATSVAARGLDVKQLKLVINYDCPTHLEDYVHRVGRTGRAGNTGTGVTFVEPSQERFSVHIAKALRQSGQPVPEDLQKMVDAFMEKVKAGKEKMSGSGFGGKGLEKLDMERESARLREKRAYKTGDDQDDEIEKEKEQDDDIKVSSAITPTPAPAASSTMPAGLPDLDGKIIVHRTERATTDSGSSNNPLDKVRQAAAAIDGRLTKKNMIHPGQPIDNKGPDAGAFHATLEINDFPQKARWAVTNRTNVAKILDATGTSITTKGNYYPPGKRPEGTDAPPLYILVEGDTENVVHTAMSELKRLLREGTMAAADSDARLPASGRYSVV